MRKGKVTIAEKIRPGDEIVTDEGFVVVKNVRKAQGRKPPVGENLHFVTDGEVLKYNSTEPVRIRRPAH